MICYQRNFAVVYVSQDITKHYDMKISKENIQSVHHVNGKKIVVLKSVEPEYKPKKKRIKAKKYFSKLKNSK